MILRHPRVISCPSRSLSRHQTKSCLASRSPTPSNPSPSIRAFTTTPSQLVTLRDVPQTTPFVPDVSTFLTLIGRKLSQHSSKITDWTALFRLSSSQLQDLGIEPARDRRYLLRWRDKFRKGEWGIGGDATHVDSQGRVELRAVEVKRGGEVERRVRERQFGKERVERFMRERAGEGVTTVNREAGVTRVVLNVPWTGSADAGSTLKKEESDEVKEDAKEDTKEDTEGAEVVEGSSSKPVIQPLSEAEIQQAAPILGFKHVPARGLSGPHIKFIKGSRCEAAFLAVQEGLWEHKRGHKVDGGERRKAEVRFKRRQAEARAARK